MGMVALAADPKSSASSGTAGQPPKRTLSEVMHAMCSSHAVGKMAFADAVLQRPSAIFRSCRVCVLTAAV